MERWYEQVKDTASREEGRGCVRNTKEHGSDHDSLHQKRHDLGDQTRCITLEDLEPPNHDSFGLHRDRDDKGTLLLRSCGVVRPCAFHVSLRTLGQADKFVEVIVHILPVNPPDVRLAVMCHKFIRRPGYAALTTFPDDAGVRVCDGDKEVRSRLSIGRLVSHVDEVFASERSRAIVDHPTLVDDTDFVEVIVDVLRGLVD